MPFVTGYLNVRERGHPDAGLPGHEGEVDPGFGISSDRPGHALPPAPPGVFPPPNSTLPIVPAPPGTPPGAIWPPLFGAVDPGYGHGGVRPPRADAGLPAQPGHPAGGPVPPAGSTQPLPPGGGGSTLPVEPKTYWVVVGVPGVGWRYCAIDPSLTVGMPLPPAAQPK